MATADMQSVKLVLKSSGSPMTFSHVNIEASDEALYELADALSSLRADSTSKILKVATYTLV